MSVGWSCLPLLPLGCILEHLSLEDALAAMSTSRHWRSGLLMYEGRRKTLKLNAKQLDKCAFLARIFKKHTNVLQIHVADCSRAELTQFMHKIMPQFFETLKLQEIVFIGPGCVQMAHSNVKLDRVMIESLLFKHSHSIRNFALMNCEMDAVDDKKPKQIHDNVEFYSRGLRFDPSSPADAILSRYNAEAMMFSSLQHILVDYDLVTTETLETLSQLTSFSQLSIIICNKKLAHSVDWRRVQTCYPNGLDVAVNLIGLSEKKIDEVMETVLVEGLTLTSLKVMFCKTLYPPLIKHVVRLHKDSLREFVVVDAPHESCQRVIRSLRAPEYEACNVNPIILMCWQCTQLRRLVLHGYWVWQYDVLGFVRLRKSLSQLEISAVYGRQRRPQQTAMARVHVGDAPDTVDASFVRQVNEYTEFKWKPCSWSRLHPGLRARAAPQHRAALALHEARRPLGVTLHSQK
ncbi:uncharacterized protein LOC134660712 isoform X1 [Cydia amplana]|uniref:uncharacterized protein LOC134660712 isoform X1 n=2 Tax=Cydia amplana TaxID=1869771 RepID=UPI002FE5EC76